jgi:hypothetical protein
MRVAYYQPNRPRSLSYYEVEVLMIMSMVVVGEVFDQVEQVTLKIPISRVNEELGDRVGVGREWMLDESGC